MISARTTNAPQDAGSIERGAEHWHALGLGYGAGNTPGPDADSEQGARLGSDAMQGTLAIMPQGTVAAQRAAASESLARASRAELAA